MVSTRDRGRGGWLIVVVVLALVAAAATVGVIVLKGDSSSAGASVLLEPAGSIGTDPFTASVAIGPAVEFPGNVRAVTVAMRKTLPPDAKTHTLVATGAAPGLYGGSGDQHVCNPQQLVTFLTQHPDKAAAWASVLGIAANDIAKYVGSLTPVVLTSDTLVTNHGYRNGHATTLQSVLQAGTAVMVDATGTPRVKCNCGNPLTPPALINPAHYRGTAWPGYTPTQVTVVKSGPTIANITVINIRTGDTFTQPFGNNAAGGEWAAAEFLPRQSGATSIVTSTDGRTWTQGVPAPASTSGLAWGDGTWIAVAQVGGAAGGGLVYESTDLQTWRQVASVAGTLSGVVYENGRWVAVGAMPDSSGNFTVGVVYSSTDGTSWTQVFSTEGASIRAVAYGNGKWLVAADEVGASSGGSSPGIATFASADGVHWAEGTHLKDQGLPWLGFGSGKWLLGGVGGTSQQMYESADATTWTPVAAAGLGSTTLGVASYGNGTWLGAGEFGTPPAGSNVYAGSAFFYSPDGKTWTRVSLDPYPIAAIAFGGASRTSGTTATSTPEPTSTATSTLGAAAPCGGAATIPAAMAISPHLGPDFEITPQIAPSDPTWARIDEQPKPGTGAGPGYGIVHCVGGKWELTDTGTDQVGCNEPDAVPIPLRAELNIHCR